MQTSREQVKNSVESLKEKKPKDHASHERGRP